MKKINNILSIVITFLLLASSCSESDPKIEDFESDKVAFNYAVQGDEYQLDYFIRSTIAFTNTSEATGVYSWDFGDGTTSTEMNPTHVYEEPGVYNVVLEIEGVGRKTNKLYISEIIPLVNYEFDAKTPIAGSTTVTLEPFVPNPRNEVVTYNWVFPEGTMDENGNVVTSSSAENPGKLKFKHIGSQQVILKSVLGARKLADVTVNVNMGYSVPSKTVYYAVKGGNMMALKLIDNLPSDVKNKPLDLGFKSGQHPFNILFNDTTLYVLDAGRQFYFVDDSFGNLGDGRITAVSKDGKNVEVMVNNNGGAAFDDPFFGFIDNSELYFTDRNTGVSKIKLDERNLLGNRASAVPFWVVNHYLGYYAQGIAYGAINSSIQKYAGVWWWAKINSSGGIFRFTDSDIDKTGTGTKPPATKPASGSFLIGEPVRSFVVDSKNQVLYVAIVNKGLYKKNLSAIAAGDLLSSFTLIASLPSDTEGTESERIYISQLVADPDNGNIYFGYRAGTGATEKTGLKRYNPTSNKIETLLENVEVYGVTINNTKSQLF